MLERQTKGIDSYVDEILDNPDGEQARLYKIAKTLNKSKLKKSYVESCLLASEDLDRISELIEIPVEVLEVYQTVFYDIRGFDKLSKLELVETRDRDESNMKLWALSAGLDFIAWRLGKIVNISPIDGLNDLFSTCIYKSKEALFNKNDSGASKESVKWVKLSMDIARLLKVWVMDSEGAKKDLELALQEVLPEFKSIDDLDGLDLKIEDD